YRWRGGDRRRLEAYLADFPALLGPDGAPPDELVLYATQLQERYAATGNGHAAPPAPGPAGLPRALGQLQLVEVLGQGGFGVVYRARDVELRRDVAVKVPHPHTLADPEQRRRFEREARHLAGLKHPHIVQVYGTGSDNGAPYLVREYVAGQTL